MKYECIDCKYETFDKSRYDRHLNSKKHNKFLNGYKIVNDNEFECLFCKDKIFSYKQNALRHYKVKHPNQHCKECEIESKEVKINNISNKDKKEEQIEQIEKTENKNDEIITLLKEQNICYCLRIKVWLNKKNFALFF